VRAFPVRLPSGARYWTVLDGDLAVVPVADGFLRQVRFGRDGAESTTRCYAYSIALFLRWCDRTGRSWAEGAGQPGSFMTWLRHAGPQASGAEPGGAGTVLAGPGMAPARSARRVNGVLAAVRGMVVHAAAAGQAPGHLVPLLYEVADDRDLPDQARGDDGPVSWRLRARHRLREPETQVDRASDAEIVAVLRACLSARDRLVVLLMARAGLRCGELCGLRRCDVHLLTDSRPLGCEVARAHLHVIRREDNPNGAWAKSRRQRTVPLDFLTVQAFDTYEFERMRVPRAAVSDLRLCGCPHNGKSRQLPLHPTTLQALAGYQVLRDRLCPAPASLLVSTTGARLCHETMQPVFRLLLGQAGIGQGRPAPRVTLHGLRHTFAVKTLLGWYRDGQDVQARMPVLSAYLGHAGPAATYWYYSDSRVIPTPAPFRA